MDGAQDNSEFLADVIMYRTPYCPYCIAAARLLKQKGVPFREVDVTANPPCREWLEETTGSSTVPQIFINGRSVRGYDDIQALDRRGLLDDLLRQAPQSVTTPPPICTPTGRAQRSR